MTPARVLDTKGDLCPIPIVKTSEAIRQIGVGEELEILATDPAATPDLHAWSRMTGHRLVSSTEESGPPTVYRFVVQRTS